MPEDLNVYTAFWEGLVPQSNRRTGFSIRGARKRDLISYQLVGFQFSYQRDWLKPDATMAFTIVRSVPTRSSSISFSDGTRLKPMLVKRCAGCRHSLSLAMLTPHLLW